MQIFAGIQDGHNNAVVPISQSISFYNKVIGDYKEKDISKYVSREDEKKMLDSQAFPVSDTPKKIAGKVIYYQKSAKNITLTIFEGGHDMLSKQALEYIEQKNE